MLRSAKWEWSMTQWQGPNVCKALDPIPSTAKKKKSQVYAAAKPFFKKIFLLSIMI
jgi:hypothetical protein